MFEEFFKLPFPMRDTRSLSPSHRQAKENLPISDRTGECQHQLTPIRITRYTKPYVSSRGVVMERFKDVGLNRCLKCGADVTLVVV